MFNINGIDWKILQVSSNHPKVRKENGEYAWGSCDNSTKTIYLRSDIPKQKLKKILCHEITHAAMFSYNILLTIDQEELIADILSTYGEEIVAITNKIFKKIGSK